MSTAGDVLRKAAADVEVRGVTRWPNILAGETCAVRALGAAARDLDYYCWEQARDTLRSAAGMGFDSSLSCWNDSQPSRAVVAAEMRNAADLADLLYGASE